MPSGASYDAPQPRHTKFNSSPAAHAGQASSSWNSSIYSEDCVNERRQRFNRRCQNQDQSEEAQEDRQGQEPSFAGVAPPQTTREIANRSRCAPEHDPSTMNG